LASGQGMAGGNPYQFSPYMEAVLVMGAFAQLRHVP